MQRKHLHLPDCPSLTSERTPCDCGRPPHPLPTKKKLAKVKGRLRVVALKHKGRDYNETRLHTIKHEPTMKGRKRRTKK